MLMLEELAHIALAANIAILSYGLALCAYLTLR